MMTNGKITVSTITLRQEYVSVPASDGFKSTKSKKAQQQETSKKPDWMKIIDNKLAWLKIQ